jgi:tetratricopeptide (TPR) repeat protein
MPCLKLPPPHPALATAAPPALAQPREVAPRIVDPSAPSLEVIFQAADQKASTQALAPAPELTAEPSAQPSAIPSPAQLGSEIAFSVMSEAVAAVEAGQLDLAVQLYGDVLDLEPDNLGARISRGRAQLNLGEQAAAMSDFQRAQDSAPESAEPLCAMGDLFFARKDYARAISRYDQALQLHPEHAMALCRRGIGHHYLGQAALALEDLEQARQLAPEIRSIDRYVSMVQGGSERR